MMIAGIHSLNRNVVNCTPRVLLVDDEAGFTRCTKASLEVNGEFEVMTVNRAHQAVDTALRFMPDVILLDVNMPDGNGGEIASSLMEFPAFRRTPIIFLTSLVTQAEILLCNGRIGGRKNLPKPISADGLAACIRDALNEQRS